MLPIGRPRAHLRQKARAGSRREGAGDAGLVTRGWVGALHCGLVTEHAHTHAPGQTDTGRACCSDGPQAKDRQARARRLVVLSGLVGLGVVILGLVIGGWIGAGLVLLIAAAIALTLAASWTRLSLNDRMMRLAVVVLLVALALVRALPR